MMDENDRIELSALALHRDRERWEQMVSSVTARALQRRAAALPRQLLAWAGPALALAAALALVVWTGALWSLSRRPARAEPAHLLSQWAANDEVPPTGRIFELLGDADVAE